MAGLFPFVVMRVGVLLLAMLVSGIAIVFLWRLCLRLTRKLRPHVLAAMSIMAFVAAVLAQKVTTVTTGVQPVEVVQERCAPVGAGVPLTRGRAGRASLPSPSAFRLSQIGSSSNSVALGVAWDAGAFAAPPFVEFTVSTNLAIGAWTLLGWAEAEAGETNLSVEVEASRLPGGTMPPAAFFRATAYDGLGADAEECAWGTNPSGADATDEGRPGSRTPVSFYFGDHSTSHSEKYQLVIKPVPGSGAGALPRSFAWVNANYGESEIRTAALTPGWSYEVRLAHASTNRPQGPDYDYTLNAVDVPQSVIVSDPDGLLGVHLSDSTFTGAGRTAVVTAYKVEVAVCSPDDDDWPELDASRVVLDDEELRIKVTVSPQMSSLAAVRQKFGDSLTVNTSGTCPQGVSMPMGDDALFVNTPGKSAIRMVKTRQQLVSLGLLPSQNEDGVNEMAWIDIVQTAGQSYADSKAFSALGYAFRGKASIDQMNSLESTPPNVP